MCTHVYMYAHTYPCAHILHTQDTWPPPRRYVHPHVHEWKNAHTLTPMHTHRTADTHTYTCTHMHNTYVDAHLCSWHTFTCRHDVPTPKHSPYAHVHADTYTHRHTSACTHTQVPAHTGAHLPTYTHGNLWQGRFAAFQEKPGGLFLDREGIPRSLLTSCSGRAGTWPVGTSSRKEDPIGSMAPPESAHPCPPLGTWPSHRPWVSVIWTTCWKSESGSRHKELSLSLAPGDGSCSVYVLKVPVVEWRVLTALVRVSWCGRTRASPGPSLVVALGSLLRWESWANTHL